MRKLSIAPFSVAIVLILTMANGALAQRGVNLDGAPQDQSSIDGSAQFTAQFNRRNRLPGERRGVNRLALGDAQLGRQPNRNLARKRELQRRLMQAIGLTPEQHQRMQEIRRSHEDEAITAGRRLRQARQALDRAIMSEPYNEAAVRQATENLAAAQADKIRLESRIRAQVRGVLTSDQVIKFHQIERQMRREMREQREQEKEMGQQGFNVPEPRIPLDPEESDLVGLLFVLP